MFVIYCLSPLPKCPDPHKHVSKPQESGGFCSFIFINIAQGPEIEPEL